MRLILNIIVMNDFDFVINAFGLNRSSEFIEN
jgi:hypothetical protein